MHEIITVQLGQQSNYLGTHFWNAQESYLTYSTDQESPIDHHVHWRPGIGADGAETFMPRAVIYDLKGGFGSLRKINALYEAQQDEGAPPGTVWDGPTVIHRQDPIAPSAYQQSLDAGVPASAGLTPAQVRYWSDFSRVYLHPRSAVQLNEYDVGSSPMPFECWSTGQDLFASLDKEHDLLDRDLRPFAEEADQMQAVQIMASLDDGWGGFASPYAERLRDEYGKTSIWVWGLQEPVRGVSREKRLLRLANKARALSEMYKQASVVVPLSVPEALPRTISLDPSSLWHLSALAASAVESAMLPSRLKDATNRATLGRLGDILNNLGKQNLATLQMSFARHNESETGEQQAADPKPRSDPRAGYDGGGGRSGVGENGDDGDGGGEPEAVDLDVDFAPRDQLDPFSHRQNGHKRRVFGQVVTRRGYRDQQSSAQEDLHRDRRRRRRLSGPAVQKYTTPLAFSLIDSFPHIFRDHRKSGGGGDSNRGDEGNEGAAGRFLTGSVSITASLSTTAAMSDNLRLLRTTVSRSIGLEDREALGNDLAEMADEYHEGWSSGSDEGDDD